MSQITTHVLDTSTGKPAEGISAVLQKPEGDTWVDIANGITNADGRVSDLLGGDSPLEPGIYRMVFNTGLYFGNKDNFYPSVTIEFETKDSSHYHIPLLLSPFGYSTYRGS